MIGDSSLAQMQGYPNDVYDRLIEAGLQVGSRVLDIGCDDGRASEPLITNGFALTGIDIVEDRIARARERFPAATWRLWNGKALPFADASFDAVISADALHRFDGDAVLAEASRILRPGGMIGLWWSAVMGEDPVSDECIAAMRESGAEWRNSGLMGGFPQFYAAYFTNQDVRVIPWRSALRIEQVVQEDASRHELHALLGGDASTYARNLRARLEARFGEGNPFVTRSRLIYLYTGLRP